MTLHRSPDPRQVLTLEELSLNAWPALHTLHYDGWLLRLAGGYTRRANSVQPLYPSSQAIPTKIAYCEQVYAAHGQDTIFKMTPSAQPPDLDARLAALGYARDAPTWVQALRLPANLPPGGGACTLDDELGDRWLDAYARMSAVEPRHLPAMRRLVTGIVPEHRFAATYEHGTIIAVGLVVVERACAGIFDIVVDPVHRRRGIGANLVRSLVLWASQRDARLTYLQVGEDNVPARRLYAKLGFRDAYRYWYRVKKVSTGATVR